MVKVAAVLIAAHAIADFILQTDNLIQRKNRLNFLMLHAGVHALLSYIALQAWACWQVPAFILIVHSLIDFSKHQYNSETPTTFIVDQIAHILSLIGLSWLLTYYSWLPEFTGIGYKPMIVVAGFIATVYGAGFLITKFTKRLIEENKLKLKGLLNAGNLIGQLERSLIFLFIFIGQPAGIGFLVAAKSIFLFGEGKSQKLAEYVLIGSLLSFSFGIALAYVTMWAMEL
ncbi:MAG: DUF3307 domain-containing protein [Desulfobacterales bacterium]|nr:DUF3307 domain-containing protein [Desulfobacterales bacterium]